MDGLKGFPEAIEAAFPDTVVQTCIVHLIRHSLELMPWKDRKAVVPELRAIHRAQDAEAGLAALEALETGPWGERYPAIARDAGAGTGTGSCRSSPSPRPCAGSSTRQRHQGPELQAAPRGAGARALPV